MKFLTILLAVLTFISETFLYSQHFIKVIVTAADTYEPLNGAIISVKNKPVTSTNEEGEFTISVNATGDTLAVSFAGFETLRIIASAQALPHVELKRFSGKLNDITVVSNGYQTN